MKFKEGDWVYFKGPNNQYYQGLIKEYDCKDYLYKIEYFNNDDGFVKNAYVLEKEILDFKFKNGEEVQFRCFAAWKRGKICASYADRDGRIFYDINPWDEMIKAYDSLRGYKEIQEMDVRPYTNYTFSFPTVSDAVLLGIDTDSIKVKKEDKKMKDIPRNHKFVKTNTKERRIKEVMFNGPATIIKWEPSTYDVFVNCNTKGDKTVSVCGKSDIYDKEKGFLLAVIKEFVDNQSYDNILRMMDSFNDEERK